MIYGYIRVSTDKQTTDNQRFEILKYADEKKLSIDEWIEETVSSTRRLSDRKLGALLTRMQKNDILIVSELSRLGQKEKRGQAAGPSQRPPLHRHQTHWERRAHQRIP